MSQAKAMDIVALFLETCENEDRLHRKWWSDTSLVEAIATRHGDNVLPDDEQQARAQLNKRVSSSPLCGRIPPMVF
jgi:hypothetical protein